MRNESAHLPSVSQADQTTDSLEPVCSEIRLAFTSRDADARAGIQAQGVQAQTEAIHQLIRGGVDARFEIGERLIALRGLLGRFEFQPLVKAEYGWSKANTTNHMNVARVFSGLEAQCRVRIHWSALVILARENVDPRARSDAVTFARSGLFVTKKIADALVGKYREVPRCGHDQLLHALCGLSEDFLDLLAQTIAVRAELTAEQDEFLDEIIGDVRRGVRSVLAARIPCATTTESFNPEPTATRDVGVAHNLAVPVQADFVTPSGSELNNGAIPFNNGQSRYNSRASVIAAVEADDPCTPKTSDSTAACLPSDVPQRSYPNEAQWAPADAPATAQHELPAVALASVKLEVPAMAIALSSTNPASVPALAPRADGPSRRGFLATVGSAVGALCAGLVPAAQSPAVQHPESIPQPAATVTANAAAVHRPATTIYTYDAQNELVSISEFPVSARHSS